MPASARASRGLARSTAPHLSHHCRRGTDRDTGSLGVVEQRCDHAVTALAGDERAGIEDQRHQPVSAVSVILGRPDPEAPGAGLRRRSSVQLLPVHARLLDDLVERLPEDQVLDPQARRLGQPRGHGLTFVLRGVADGVAEVRIEGDAELGHSHAPILPWEEYQSRIRLRTVQATGLAPSRLAPSASAGKPAPGHQAGEAAGHGRRGLDAVAALAGQPEQAGAAPDPRPRPARRRGRRCAARPRSLTTERRPSVVASLTRSIPRATSASSGRASHGALGCLVGRRHEHVRALGLEVPRVGGVGHQRALRIEVPSRPGRGTRRSSAAGAAGRPAGRRPAPPARRTRRRRPGRPRRRRPRPPTNRPAIRRRPGAGSRTCAERTTDPPALDQAPQVALVEAEHVDGGGVRLEGGGDDVAPSTARGSARGPPSAGSGCSVRPRPPARPAGDACPAGATHRAVAASSSGAVPKRSGAAS